MLWAGTLGRRQAWVQGDWEAIVVWVPDTGHLDSACSFAFEEKT